MQKTMLMSPLRLLLVTALFSVIGSPVIANAAESLPEPNEAQIREWINHLANPSPPRVHRLPIDAPSERLTAEEQKNLIPVREAHRQLTKHFLIALPFLMEFLKDKRYSYPREHPSSSVYENQTVGNACEYIIEQKVLLRNPWLTDARGIAVRHDLPIDKAWFERIRKMSLFEMQADALNWILKQPPATGVSPLRWEKELAEVQKFRDDFVRKGNPIDESFGPPIEGR